jgi:hypothetical protein
MFDRFFKGAPDHCRLPIEQTAYDFLKKNP